MKRSRQKGNGEGAALNPPLKSNKAGGFLLFYSYAA